MSNIEKRRNRVNTLFFVDITSKPLSGNQLQFKVSSFIGLNPVQVRVNPFNSTDDWMWGFGLGKCDETQAGNDGTMRINQEINARYIVPQTVINPVHMFFTDVGSIWIQSSDFFKSQ